MPSQKELKMANDRVKYELAPERASDINKKTSELRTLCDFTVVLTPEERSVLPIMGDKTVAFVEKSLDMAKSNPQLLPPYLDIPELERDLKLAKALNPIINDLEIILSNLKDTSLLAGSEAYSAALVFYNTVKAAQRTNVSGAETIYNELKERFPGRPKTIKIVEHKE